jgi:hypothetical protein
MSPAQAAAVASQNAAANPYVQAQVSRVYLDDTRSREHTIATTDVIEEAFHGVECITGLIYVHGGDTNGVLADATATTYLGRTSKYLTEIRGIGDQSVPVIIAETSRSERQPARVYVRGAAGTKITLIYR